MSLINHVEGGPIQLGGKQENDMPWFTGSMVMKSLLLRIEAERAYVPFPKGLRLHANPHIESTTFDARHQGLLWYRAPVE